MEWTDFQQPNQQTPHNHIEIATPLGRGVIELKDWYDGPGDDDKWLGISVDGEYVGEVGEYPGDPDKLDGYVVGAKWMLEDYLRKKRDELDQWLGEGWFTLWEKVPESGVRVLIETDKGDVVISWTDDKGEWGLDLQVVKWRYLPK